MKKERIIIVGKLYYKYGTMGSSKSTEALITKYRYDESGQKALLCKTKYATRNGNYIYSRLGLTSEAIDIEDVIDDKTFLKQYDLIIIDECQFLSIEDVDKLGLLVDTIDISVICFGLKNDKTTHLFDGSKRLLEISDSIAEIKNVCCKCGRKAIFDIKISDDTDVNSTYVSLCRSCARNFKNFK